MKNVSNISPHIFPVVQSDSAVFDPPLAGIDVFTAGTVTVKNAQGTSCVLVFPAAEDGGRYPARYWAQIRQIMDTGTDIADASLFALK